MDLAGLRSEEERLRACVGSMSDCALCTRLVRLNIAHDSAALLAAQQVCRVAVERTASRESNNTAFDIIPPHSPSRLLSPLLTICTAASINSRAGRSMLWDGLLYADAVPS